MDSDFVAVHECVGRTSMHSFTRIWRDFLCRRLGHNLWRVMNAAIMPKDLSLECYSTYCRRCYRGGYVMGDYRPERVSR
jgi:hypothetical protein